MKKLNQYIAFYKTQLQKWDIVIAYTQLVKYMMNINTILSKNLSSHFVFWNLFQGYMDYTYFYFSNDFLKKRKLKLGLVLNHKEMQFELWLLGSVLPVQEKYWQFFKTTRWSNGKITKPQYAILEYILIKNPDFDNLDTLSKEIERKLIIVSYEIIEDLKKSILH